MAKNIILSPRRLGNTDTPFSNRKGSPESREKRKNVSLSNKNMEILLLFSLLMVITVTGFTSITPGGIRRVRTLPSGISSKIAPLRVQKQGKNPAKTRPPKSKTHNINKEENQPWRASYHTSCQTQKTIQHLAWSLNDRRKNISPQRRTEGILRGLLEKIPPEECNAANLVCALTLSTKQIYATPNKYETNRKRSKRNQDNVRLSSSTKYWLYKAFDVLHDLVCVDNALSARQLCNSIYTIAKIYNFDPSILPAASEQTSISAELESNRRKHGVAEKWIIEDYEDAEDGESTTNGKHISSSLLSATPEQRRLKITVDTIALRLADLLCSTEKQKPKVGEASMACWAYGTLKHRSTPPGWIMPPQISQLQKNTSTKSKNTITFERWVDITQKDDYIYSKYEEEEDEEEHHKMNSVTQFFDAVALYLNEEVEKNRKLTSKVEEMTWNEIANVAWAFASHGHCRSEASEELMATLAAEAAYRLEKASEVKTIKDLAPPSAETIVVNITSNAISTKGNNTRQQKHHNGKKKSKGKLNSKERRSLITTFLPRDISQLVWSMGTLQSDNFHLCDDLASLIDALALYYLGDSSTEKEESSGVFKSWSNTDLVQLGVSLGHGRIDHQPLLVTLFQEAINRLLQQGSQDKRSRPFQEWEVSVLLWVQARLYLKDIDPIFQQFTSLASTWLQQRASRASSLKSIGIGDQEKANLAWTLTVLEAYKQDDPEDTIALLRQIFQEASSSATSSLIQLEHAHQLWQALFLIEHECPEILIADDGSSLVPDEFRTFLEDKWNDEKARQKISSARHKALSETLELMGIAHYNEHDEDIDVAIVLKEDASWTSEVSEDTTETATVTKKVALEFDGPLHFTREIPGQQQRTLGHTVLKYRLLKMQGWAVVRVPYYEFDKIPFWASMERQRYLQRKLKTHASLRFSEKDVSEYWPLSQKTPRQSRFD